MPMNRVQIQGGLPLAEFMDRHGSVEACEATLALSRWPAGFIDPQCEALPRTTIRRQGRLYDQYARRGQPRTQARETTFGASSLPLTRWFLGLHLPLEARTTHAAGAGSGASAQRTDPRER